MQCFVRFIGQLSAAAIVGASALGVHAAGLATDGERILGGGTDGVVAGLSLASHLDPLTPDQVRSTEFKPAAYSIDAQPRLTMPAVDRSRTLVLADLFPNTKSIVPILVSDLDPNTDPVSRPMSARSVGARPSLPPSARPLTRPLGR